MATFAGKEFNAEVFQRYVDRIPNTKRKELLKSRAIITRPELANAMREQAGGNYLTTPLKGLATGTAPNNYDGNTDIDAESTVTYKHSRVVVGRAKAWEEQDFTADITGEDWMANIAQQVSEYWDEVDQDTLLSILKGVFAMNGAGNNTFVKKHTYNVSAITNSEGKVGFMDGTTMNTGMQRACGDNKAIFSMALMHSAVSTNLENMKLLVYLKYNDANGMERDLSIGTLNGRLVLVDDGMPSETVYKQTQDTDVDPNKFYFTKSGEKYTEVESPVKGSISTYYEEDYTTYTTYVLGNGAIEFTDCGAKVPYEADRDPKVKGGKDLLYTRQRKCWAPYGISFTMSNMATLSPTDEELEDGRNWALVCSSTSPKKFIDHKAVPIARIISRG